MEYYYDNLSQPCRAVYMLMKLNNIDFISKDINLAERTYAQFIQLVNILV